MESSILLPAQNPHDKIVHGAARQLVLDLFDVGLALAIEDRHERREARHLVHDVLVVRRLTDLRYGTSIVQLLHYRISVRSSMNSSASCSATRHNARSRCSRSSSFATASSRCCRSSAPLANESERSSFFFRFLALAIWTRSRLTSCGYSYQLGRSSCPSYHRQSTWLSAPLPAPPWPVGVGVGVSRTPYAGKTNTLSNGLLNTCIRL